MKEKLPLDRWREKAREFLGRYKFVLLVVAAGLALLLWPGGKSANVEDAAPTAEPALSGEEDFSVAALEAKLSDALSKIQGAGDVTVMLTVQGGSQRVLARDETLTHDADGSSQSERTTVITSGGSSAGDAPVLVQQLYPRFKGALVVCAGAGSASVRLELMEAVSALTGLGTDKISICKGKG